MKYCVINPERNIGRFHDFSITNILKFPISIFKAFDGKNINRKDLLNPKYFSANLAYTNTALACALSHLTLWERVIETDTAATIFEDDVIIHPKFEELSQKILGAMKLDWDMVVWVWNFDCPMQFAILPGVSPCLGTFLEDSLRRNIAKYKILELDPKTFELDFCFGTPAYSISPNGAKKIIKNLCPIRNFELDFAKYKSYNVRIDIALMTVYASINAFVSVPPLAIAPNNSSDVEKINAPLVQ